VWPRVPDQHKPGKPLIPWGLGVVYVLFAIVYLFLMNFLKIDTSTSGVSASLTLAVCVLFGGFMGMLDDWIDLKWRYKAFMPLIAALPLIYYATANPYNALTNMGVRTSIFVPLLGTVQFGQWYYYLIIPLVVMVVTNAINMLGGLNGLETICPAIVLIGLTAISSSASQVLMIGPLIMWLVLAVYNVRGKIFVGNTGSFAIGLTVVAFAVLTDQKLSLVVSIIPYVFNSVLILLTIFFVRKKASVEFDGKKLVSDHRRSLVTLITYKRPLTERQIVVIISVLVVVFTVLAVLAETH
jgi:UDP-N-acetylglucosamine--dolichyl-phosphate N-acetylglucosaminephosphotransferase